MKKTAFSIDSTARPFRFPPYPEGFFQNKGMYPYGYQNGGDWTWFGARMIQQLVRNGFAQEAYAEVRPIDYQYLTNTCVCLDKGLCLSRQTLVFETADTCVC